MLQYVQDLVVFLIGIGVQQVVLVGDEGINDGVIGLVGKLQDLLMFGKQLFSYGILAVFVFNIKVSVVGCKVFVQLDVVLVVFCYVVVKLLMSYFVGDEVFMILFIGYGIFKVEDIIGIFYFFVVGFGLYVSQFWIGIGLDGVDKKL